VDTLFAISNALSSAGNFTTAFMQCFIEPRWVLAFLAVGAIVFSTLAMNLTGYAGIAVVLVVFFVEGGILVTTFAICVRGMGRHTKMAASVLITALVGGAPFPVIQNYVHASQSAQYAVCVTVALFASGSTLSLYLNLVAPARRQVDRRIELHRTQAPQMTSSVTEPPEITSSCGVLSVHESDDQNPDAITRSSV
jgi:fucose permease